jgi:hypothetical protein
MRLIGLVVLGLLTATSACRSAARPPADASAPPPPVTAAPPVDAAPTQDEARSSQAPFTAASIAPGSPLSGAAHKAWSGPHATLTDICSERCKIEERPTKAAPGIDRVASYGDGNGTYLALHTAKGWFVEVPELMKGLMLSHHSPRGAWLALDTMVGDAAGLRVTRTEGGSNFIGGMGNMGSSSFRKTSWIHCAAKSGAISCTEPVTVFEESCRAPMDSNVRTCKVGVSYIDKAAAKLLARGWQDAQDGRWVPDTVKLPPSHFRGRLVFEPGGALRVLVLAPDDAHYEVTGTWAWEGPDRVRLRYDSGRGGVGAPVDRTLRIVAIDDGSLRFVEP